MFFKDIQGGVRGIVIIKCGKGDVNGGVTFLIYGGVEGGVDINSDTFKVTKKLRFDTLSSCD